jgi:hypothetical protein
MLVAFEDVDPSDSNPGVLARLRRLHMLPVALCRRAVSHDRRPCFVHNGLDRFQHAARPPRLKGLDLREQCLTVDPRVAIIYYTLIYYLRVHLPPSSPCCLSSRAQSIPFLVCRSLYPASPRFPESFVCHGEAEACLLVYKCGLTK